MEPNRAAYLVARQQKPLEVRDAPTPTASGNDIVIRNRACAANPVDWFVQSSGLIVKDYPCILGVDGAGEIAAVGPDVDASRFRVGDRVLAWTNVRPPAAPRDPLHGTFQRYIVTDARGVARIPDSLPFTEACVVPLALCTAASAMFEKGGLALPFPQLEPPNRGETVLIWGGSTSVGGFAIQMARAAGFEVVTTARAKNFEYCKDLGAVAVFDYTSPTVVDDVVAALKDKKVAAVMDAWSRGDGPKMCCEIISKLGLKKFLQTVIPPQMPIAGVAEGIEIGRGKNPRFLRFHDITKLTV
jgi:NADPH:quinone reductase-like Zn-dependent oxidoreductase